MLQIFSYLCTLFNVIFESGSYPDAWSKGVIVPIFKKGDRKNPANYRGITFVNITAKIFSLCLRNRINNWCESEHIFNEQQYGFRENKSTTDAIFFFITYYYTKGFISEIEIILYIHRLRKSF